MTINSLRALLTPDFINKTAKVGTSTNAGSEVAKSLSGKGSEDLGTTLRTGARNFASGVQALNVGISYLQVSRDSQKKLLVLADDLATVIKSASEGSQPTSALINAFTKISKQFETGIRQAKIEDNSVLDVDELTTQMKNAGLDPARTDELAQVFKKISSLGKLDSTSVTESSGALPPAAVFRQALSKAHIALEDESGDAPARKEFFQSIQEGLSELRGKISQNIQALDEGVEFVAKNLNLVRTSGLAFLDASNQITGTEEADAVALNLQQAIRAKAKGDVVEAKYLTNILEAGVALLQEKTK